MPATIVSSFAAVTSQQPTVLVIGNFDGVHLGHQALLKQVVASAEKLQARPAALTFYPHPRELLHNAHDPFYLSRLEERLERIAAHGIDLIITHPFDEKVRRTTADQFVHQMVEHLELKALWGGNFTLGYQRQGDLAYLQKVGQKNNFSVHQCAPITNAQGVQISSTAIRQLLGQGEVAQAAKLLGRPYRMTGPVVMGKQLGRTIGVPTANVATWEKQLLPANGVYATWVEFDGIAYQAATNVGVRPTVDGENRITVETHLLDFSAEIYDQQLTITFIDAIRPEQKFSDLNALKSQIQCDIEQVRARLSQ